MPNIKLKVPVAILYTYLKKLKIDWFFIKYVVYDKKLFFPQLIVFQHKFWPGRHAHTRRDTICMGIEL